MDIATMLQLDKNVKGLEFDAEIVKIYPAQARGEYYYQDLMIKDKSGSTKLSLGLKLDPQTKMPINSVSESNVGNTIHCTKAGINEYQNRKNLKTSVFSLGGASNQTNVESATQPVPSPKTAVSVPNKGIVNTSVPQEMWDNKERRSFRAMSLAYAKDLAVAGKIDKVDIEVTAKDFIDFIYENHDKEIKTDSGIGTSELPKEEPCPF